MMVFLKSVGVKENRTTLLCKKSGGDTEICEVKGQDVRRGHGSPLWRSSGETSGRKEGESSRKNPLASSPSWGPRQDHPPLSSLKSLRKTLTTRGDAKNRLRDFRGDLERRHTHRQPRGNTVYPHAWGIHRRFIKPSQAIVIFRGTGYVFATKSWQPRRKQNVQRSKKQIHLALRFRARGLGLRTAELTA
jgi:hypothetical protein